MPKTARTIGPNTILGFHNPESHQSYYVTYDREVKGLYSDHHVGDDPDTFQGGNPVFGRDIAPGIDLTVRCVNQEIEDGRTDLRHVCDWVPNKGKVDTLPTKVALQLVHKWFIENELINLFQRECPHLSPSEAFSRWLQSDLVPFTPSQKHIWKIHASILKKEMSIYSRDFRECRFEMTF